MAEFQDSIEIEAPPQAVFEYLTTNKGMTAWMGQYADLDPSPGGRFAVDIAGSPVRGEYLVVEPFQRVVVSWGFAGSDELPTGASKVEFILTPITGGTRVDLRHLDLLVHYKGEYVGIREMRKHAAWYTRGFTGSAELRERFNRAASKDEFINILRDAWER